MRTALTLVILLLAGCASTGYAPPGMSADEEYRIRVLCQRKYEAAYAHPNWMVEFPITAGTLARNRCLTENGILGVQ